MIATRTRERLAAGLPWPREQVLELYDEVAAKLRDRGRDPDEAHDAAYRGVMALGAVCAAVAQPCPSASVVLAIIDRGEQIVAEHREAHA